MMIDRGPHDVEHARFPVVFARHRGRLVLIHGTAWNRLDVFDPRTGERMVQRHGAGARVGGHLQRPQALRHRVQPLLGLVRRPAGAVAVVHTGDAGLGDHVARDPALHPRDGGDLVERQPVHRHRHRRRGGHRGDAERGLVDRVVGLPRPRDCS